MTISTTTSRVDYTGDGSSTAFSVPFPFFDATELRVLERVIATGAETTLALSTNYTVSGGDGATGTVTALVAPAATKQWTILRNTRRTQEVDYLPNDSFPAETHERALDRLTAEIQENERDAARSLRIAETDAAGALTLPSSVDRALRVLGFNAAGEPVAVVPEAGSLVITPFAQTLLDDTTATQARATLGAIERAGFRNLIINGNPTINQRIYVSGAATVGANQYTLDRWRVVTSGQALSWSDSAGIRTITAPAGGVEQVIEGASVFAGEYTLSWAGTATATVNGAAVANGGQVTLPGNTNATVRLSGGTAQLIQLEPGTLRTPFEMRPAGIELSLCQRYFSHVSVGLNFSGNASGASAGLYQTIHFPVPMRVAPTVSLSATGGVNVVVSVGNVGTSSATINGVSVVAGTVFWGTTTSTTFSAEL
jgi:hypothetical protein